MSAILDSLLDRERLADCAREAGKEPYFFKDDDVYICDARSLKIIRHISCKSPEYIGARLHGFKVHPGQMVLLGLQARGLGVKS
jgi:hypothetical protein